MPNQGKGKQNSNNNNNNNNRSTNTTSSPTPPSVPPELTQQINILNVKIAALELNNTTGLENRLQELDKALLECLRIWHSISQKLSTEEEIKIISNFLSALNERESACKALKQYISLVKSVPSITSSSSLSILQSAFKKLKEQKKSLGEFLKDKSGTAETKESVSLLRELLRIHQRLKRELNSENGWVRCLQSYKAEEIQKLMDNAAGFSSIQLTNSRIIDLVSRYNRLETPKNIKERIRKIITEGLLPWLINKKVRTPWMLSVIVPLAACEDNEIRKTVLEILAKPIREDLLIKKHHIHALTLAIRYCCPLIKSKDSTEFRTSSVADEILSDFGILLKELFKKLQDADTPEQYQVLLENLSLILNTFVEQGVRLELADISKYSDKLIQIRKDNSLHSDIRMSAEFVRQALTRLSNPMEKLAQYAGYALNIAEGLITLGKAAVEIDVLTILAVVKDAVSGAKALASAAERDAKSPWYELLIILKGYIETANAGQLGLVLNILYSQEAEYESIKNKPGFSYLLFMILTPPLLNGTVYQRWQVLRILSYLMGIPVAFKQDDKQKNITLPNTVRSNIELISQSLPSKAATFYANFLNSKIMRFHASQNSATLESDVFMNDLFVKPFINNQVKETKGWCDDLIVRQKAYQLLLELKQQWEDKPPADAINIWLYGWVVSYIEWMQSEHIKGLKVRLLTKFSFLPIKMPNLVALAEDNAPVQLGWDVKTPDALSKRLVLESYRQALPVDYHLEYLYQRFLQDSRSYQEDLQCYIPAKAVTRLEDLDREGKRISLIEDNGMLWDHLKGEKTKVIFIQGLAGAGKSLLVRKLTELLWQKYHTAIVSDYNDKDNNNNNELSSNYIPLFIPLSQLNDPTEKGIEQWLKIYGWKEEEIDQLKSEVREKQRKLLVIFDGLDDVKNLKDLYSAYQLTEWNAKIIITSQIGQLSKENLHYLRLNFDKAENLQEYFLVNFDVEETKNYVRKILQIRYDSFDQAIKLLAEKLRQYCFESKDYAKSCETLLAEVKENAVLEIFIQTVKDDKGLLPKNFTLQYLQNTWLPRFEEYARTKIQKESIQSIRDYLLNLRQQKTIEFVDKETIKQLLQSPFLLKLVLDVFTKLQLNREYTRFELYTLFVQQWYDREALKITHDKQIKLASDFQLIPSFKAYAEELAFEMFTYHERSIALIENRYMKLKERQQNLYRRYFIAKENAHIAKLGVPLRYTSTNVEFLHSSIQDYYVACEILPDIYAKKTPSVDSSFNLVRLDSEKNILEFLKEAIFSDVKEKEQIFQNLLKIVRVSQTQPRLARMAANAMTLLVFLGFSFKEEKNKDFHGIKIPNADLTGADLSGLNFSGADFSNVCLRNCDLSNTNFSYAEMKGVDFGELPAFPHSRPLQDMIVSPDETWIAVICGDNNLYLWDLETGTYQVKTIKHDVYIASDIIITNLSLINDGTNLQFANHKKNEIYAILDVKNWSNVKIPAQKSIPVVVNKMLLSPDKQWKVDLNTGKISSSQSDSEILILNSSLTSTCWSKNSEYLAVGFNDGSVEIYSTIEWNKSPQKYQLGNKAIQQLIFLFEQDWLAVRQENHSQLQFIFVKHENKTDVIKSILKLEQAQFEATQGLSYLNLRLLEQKKEKLNTHFSEKDYLGWKASHFVIANAPLDVIKEKINNAQINLAEKTEKEGYAALHIAARYRDKAVVELLLAQNVSFEEKDNRGRTPGELAHEIVNQEQRNGILSILPRLDSRDVKRNALHFAIIDPDLSDQARISLIKKILQSNTTKINARDENDCTPLHEAAARGYLEIVALLLEKKANPNAKNNAGDTPLHLAILNRDKNKDKEIKEIIKRLLDNPDQERKADVNAVGSNCLTPLHMAAEKGDEKLVELLLQFNPVIDATNWETKLDTPLHFAAKNGHENVYNLLKNKSKEPKNKAGKTAEQLLSEFKSKSMDIKKQNDNNNNNNFDLDNNNNSSNSDSIKKILSQTFMPPPKDNSTSEQSSNTNENTFSHS